ncbi:sucrose-phosphate phosphatase [Mastigocladus laminosus UU774]|nr:sucrose-phosphate phosphatase [Mastigocladus laminosus UU774]
MNPFLFVTDLDGTLVGDKHALEKLNSKLEWHRREYGTKIVYATGRSLTLYSKLTTEELLIKPDALVTSVGTEIYFDNHNAPDTAWSEKLSAGWDHGKILKVAENFVELVPQQKSEQSLYKISFNISEQAATQVLPQLKSALDDLNLQFKLIYSGGKDLDILPIHADKGLAVKFLQQKWEIHSHTTVVCGDSGNDIALFNAGEERGIIVGNAQPELLKWYKANLKDYRYLAKAEYAAGILEGLQYFEFIEKDLAS